MVAVVQVEVALAAQNARDVIRITLVPERAFRHRPRRAQPGRIAHIVVGGAHQVTRVSFFDQLGNRAGREKRKVVRMRLQREQHFSLVRLALGRALQENSACGGLLLGVRPSSHGRARHHAAHKFATQHASDYTLTRLP